MKSVLDKFTLASLALIFCVSLIQESVALGRGLNSHSGADTIELTKH